MYTINQVKNYATILKSGKDTFWASDFGFNGGDISGLKKNFIRPTGNTKEILVDIGDGLFKKVEVQEWRVRNFNDPSQLPPWEGYYVRQLNKAINAILITADLLREAGF